MLYHFLDKDANWQVIRAGNKAAAIRKMAQLVDNTWYGTVMPKDVPGLFDIEVVKVV